MIRLRAARVSKVEFQDGAQARSREERADWKHAEPGGTSLVVRVLHPDQTPVEGALVKVSAGRGLVARGRTGRSGGVELTIPPGVMKIDVSWQHYDSLGVMHPVMIGTRSTVTVVLQTLPLE